MFHRSAWSFVYGFALCVSLTGCGDPIVGDTAQIAVSPVAGSWNLDGVGAWRVPVSIEVVPRVSRWINVGTAALNHDNTWTLRYEYRDLGATLDTRGTFSASGTYAAPTSAATAFVLRDEMSGRSYRAVVNADNSLDVNVDNYRFHFVAR
jgi:hypothetical protein